MDDSYKIDDVIALLKKISARQNIKVALPHKETTDYVSPQEIVCIEANIRNAIVTLSNGTSIKVSKSLKDFDEQLCDNDLHFMRIHFSFIINLNFITRYLKEHGGQVVMQGNKTIPVSKNKKEEVLRFLNL